MIVLSLNLIYYMIAFQVFKAINLLISVKGVKRSQ